MISAYIRRNSPPIAIIASRPSADAGLLALAPNRFKDFWREWMPSMFAKAAWILAWRLGLVPIETLSIAGQVPGRKQDAAVSALDAARWHEDHESLDIAAFERLKLADQQFRWPGSVDHDLYQTAAPWFQISAGDEPAW